MSEVAHKWVNEVARWLLTYGAKTTFAGASSLSRHLAPPIACLADDINDLTDPINDAKGTEQ